MIFPIHEQPGSPVTRVACTYQVVMDQRLKNILALLNSNKIQQCSHSLIGISHWENKRS